jgi:hypothetical protein
MSLHPETSYSPDDFFSRQMLELSFRLLRNNNPGLATAIKKALDEIHLVPYEILHKAHTGEMYFNAQLLTILNVHIIGKIVATLTEIGERALHNQELPAEHIKLLRNLIDDWVQLAEWVLRNSSSDKAAIH